VPERTRCQVAVLGSGPGGAVTAATLTEAGLDVMLLEEGPNLSIDSCEPFSLAELRQKYRSGGLNPAIGNARIPVVEGCCVGGGSEINSGLYHRTPESTLSVWREQFGVQSLDEAGLSTHFEACERTLSVQPGPIHPASSKLRSGAECLGWNTVHVPRWVKEKKRQSMTETFIPAAKDRGCRVVPNMRAHRLEKRNDGWRVHTGASEIDAEAVFVCCGATGTPALLRRSGIDANVGNSLALHPMIKVVAVFEDEINSECTDIAAQQVSEFAPKITMGCSVSSLPYLALAMTDHPDAKLDLRDCWRRMSIYYAAISGPNSGRIRNVPGSSAPLIRYSLGQREMQDLAMGLQMLCQLLLSAGAKCLYPGVRRCSAIRSEEDLMQLPLELDPERTSLSSVHLFSSCPMGERQESCAVDSFGQVFGQRNLFVNDASILCTSPGVNPQGTIMALARRNAQHFLQR
jgi:choline dehydrogenase-like flavoprotein